MTAFPEKKANVGQTAVVGTPLKTGVQIGKMEENRLPASLEGMKPKNCAPENGWKTNSSANKFGKQHCGNWTWNNHFHSDIQ